MSPPWLGTRRWKIGAAAGLAALTLAACAQAPKGSPVAVAPAVAATAPSHADPTRQAIDLLTRGKDVEARPILERALAEDPGDKAAKRLLQQLDQDPRALLGTKAEPYRVKPGETLSMLAGRFLGDSLLFYALARYNGLDSPAEVQPGQVLQIPRLVRPTLASPRAKAPKPAAKAEAPAPVRDPARAGQLRAAGLEQLNRGAPIKAAALLQQALVLDPGNPAIQRDLGRAERIRASLAANR